MTEQYDPEKHGDGLTVMVPMDVEPPEGIDVLLWRDDEWTCAQSKMVKACRHANYDGWSFIPDVKFIAPALPPKPEPVKSYVGLVDERNDFVYAPISTRDKERAAVVSPLMIGRHAKPSKALIHFIYDHLPTDEDRAAIIKTLTEGEG